MAHEFLIPKLLRMLLWIYIGRFKQRDLLRIVQPSDVKGLGERVFGVTSMAVCPACFTHFLQVLTRVRTTSIFYMRRI